MPWRPNVTVAAVIERDGKFLLVEEQAEGKRVLNQPAGHLERGESLVEAVVRETLEETAWHFTPQALLGVYRWRHPHKDQTFLRFAFTGTLQGQAAERPLDADIVRTLWLEPEEIRRAHERHRSPMVQRCIDDFLGDRPVALDCLKEIAPSR